MIKKTITFASYALAFFGVATTTSCSKGSDELCYKCTYDGDSETICYDDFKDDYCDDCDKDDFKDFISYLEDYYDVNCSKK